MKRKWLFFFILLILSLSLGCVIKYLRSDNYQFEQYTKELFAREIAANTLNLHYTLAHPEKMHIESPNLSIGDIDLDGNTNYKTLQDAVNQLNQYSYQELSRDNQIILDMLILYYQTEQSFRSDYPLAEYLSPTLGIQAQLPILLAEYTFYDEGDLQDYLGLLSQTELYFQEILQYEEKKAAEGLFMSNQTLNRILLQCQTFLSDKKHTYLRESFQERMKALDLSAKKEQAYTQKHDRIISNSLTPAYQHLMKGLNQCRNKGKNNDGLFYYNGGQEYYQYLVRSEVGDYDSISEIQKRLTEDFSANYQALHQLLKEHPQLVRANEFSLSYETPEEILHVLHARSQEDFPILANAPYEVKYVPDSLKAYVSPAFYLVPPIDTLSPNVIYINDYENYDDLALFTTLAHEGFPGHLYQTMYFSHTNPQPIRYLLNYGGYVEGWATYVEAYAYSYASDTSFYPQVMWLNRAMNLSLYASLDINIHYWGWTRREVTSFLNSFGITDPAGIEDLYLNIVENPCNFLKYYLGYLNFKELKLAQQNLKKNTFENKDFHQEILELGPLPFPLVEKYIQSSD